MLTDRAKNLLAYLVVVACVAGMVLAAYVGQDWKRERLSDAGVSVPTLRCVKGHGCHE